MRTSKEEQDYANTSTGTSSGTTTSSVGETPDIATLRGYSARVDPSIPSRVGGALRRMNNTFQNPSGGSATPAMKDAIMRSNERELNQQAGEQFREGQFDANRLDQARLTGLAELTAPRTVQSNETSSSTNSGKGTITQTPSWLSTIGGLVQGGASAFG